MQEKRISISRRALWQSVGIAMILSIASAILANALLEERVSIVGDLIGLELSFNAGIAFGLQIPGVFQPILIGIAMLIVLRIAYYDARDLIEQVGFGLIIGGAVANIVDRVFDGLVTDMIQVGSFPIFNVADSFITIGAFVVLLSMFHKKALQK